MTDYEQGIHDERQRIVELLEVSDAKIDIKLWRELFPGWTSNFCESGCCINYEDGE